MRGERNVELGSVWLVFDEGLAKKRDRTNGFA